MRGGLAEIHAGQSVSPWGGEAPAASRPSRSGARMSAARRGLRNTCRWPTDGFSASRPGGDQRLADGEGELRARCRRSRARDGRRPCGTRPTSPSRRAAGGSGGRRAGPGRGPRAGGWDGAPSRIRAGRRPPPRAPRPSGRPPGGRRAARPPRRSAAGGRRRSARAAADVAEHGRRAPRAHARAAGRARRRGPRRRAGRARRACRGRAAAHGRREHEEALVELARGEAEVGGARGRARGGEVDQRGHGRGDQQPRALGRLLGIGAQGGGGRRGGQQPGRARRRRRSPPASRSPTAAA